jgi:hypothetical protein
MMGFRMYTIDVTRTIKLPILFHGSTHDLLSGFTSVSTVSRCQFWLLRKQLVIIITIIFFSFIDFSLSIFSNNNSNHI